MQSCRRLIGIVLPMALPGLLTASIAVQAGEVPAGAGSFTTEKPAHRWAPATAEGYDQTVPQGQPWGIYVPRQEQSPKVTNRFQNSGKPTPTHEFWSSVIWPHAVKNLIRNENGGIIETNVDTVPYSHWMSNSPYTLKFTNRGVNLTYAQIPLLVPYRYEDPNSDKRVLPSTSNPKFTAYTYPARIDPRLDPLGGTELNIRFDGMDADETQLDNYSDFAATVLLKNPGANENTQAARVTLVNGSPYIHFQKTGLSTVSFTYFNGMRIVHESDGVLALYLGDVRAGYGIFAPPGTQFSYNLANLDLKELASNGQITMTLPASHQYFSVAVLPNEINDIFKAPISYTEQGLAIAAGTAVSDLPTHIAGTRQPLVVSRLVGDFFREDEAGDGVGVEELDELIADYRRHAYALPTDTRFDYSYHEATAEVVSTYTVTTHQLGTEQYADPEAINQTMMGLYRHQYINAGDLDYAYTYSTPRGEMKVIKGNSFETRIQHPGLLPNLPNKLEGAELERLMTLLEQDKNGQWADGLTQNDVLDTYNNGKELNWMLQLLHIAEQTGRSDIAATLMGRIKAHLEDWLSADDWQQDLAYNNSHCNPMTEPARSNCYRDLRRANERKYFYYNEEWNSLTGFPASFGSDTELNDHHFHAGYLISAAAAIARYDHSWAQQWKPMVDLLIKDSANWDRSDTRFQYLRYFDIYSGYSLANGHLNMDAGGNQESSSESINFAQAVALWGSETGDTAIRDLGIFLYASEIQAIHQYWFDVDSEVFPRNVFWDNGSQFVQKDFDRASVGLVWHSKADYGTWFSAAPRMIAGINFLPVTGASLHLGHMERKLSSGGTIPSLQLVMDRLNEDTHFFASVLWHRDLPAEYTQYDFRRKTKFWDDLMWQAEALVNPQSAADKFNAAGNYKTEFDPSLAPLYPNDEVRSEAGASKTHTYHWIFNLRQLGRPVQGISADSAHYAVFEKNGTRTYVAYNPTATPKTVTFSDGVSISVAPFSMSGDYAVAPAVSNLSVANLSFTGASASWAALTGEWTGASYRAVVKDSSGSEVFNQLVTGTSVAITGLSHNTDYTLSVTSVFDGLNGRAAYSSFATPLDTSLVPTVKNLSASNVDHQSVTLSWSAIPAAYLNADYAIELRSNGTLIQSIPSTGGAVQRAITGLNAATSYQVSVIARNNAVQSPAATLNVVTGEAPPACDPSAAYCIEATSCSAVRMTLNRSAVWADIRLTSPMQSGGYRMSKTAEGKSYFDVTGLSNNSGVNFEFTYFDTVGHDLGPYSYSHSTANCGTSSSAPSSSSSSSTSTSTSTSSSTSSSSSSSLSSSSSSVAVELGVVKMTALANGAMQFSIRLNERKQQVHLFARRNGAQDYVITDLQATEVNNGDGTYTYQITRSAAYAAGNLVEARFYTFTPASGQVFYPGPGENSWTSMTYPGASSASSQSSSSVPSSSSSSSLSSSSSSSSSSVATNGYTASAVTPNGANVAYTTTASYSNGAVKITFTTTENLNWVWVFTPGWNNMTRVQGNSFELTIPNVAPGTALSYYFTLSTATRGEGNNNNQPHQWLVQ